MISAFSLAGVPEQRPGPGGEEGNKSEWHKTPTRRTPTRVMDLSWRSQLITGRGCLDGFGEQEMETDGKQAGVTSKHTIGLHLGLREWQVLV